MAVRHSTLADAEMYRAIKHIIVSGTKDVNPRPRYEDGTPAHTISVNHVVRKYDLADGEFPLLTLRPIAWKTAIREVLSIYQKATNNLEEMDAMGVTWWHPWDIGDGTIGQRYGATVGRYNLMHSLIDGILINPFGRRHIMDLWQEADLNETPGLMPCAFLTIWNVRQEQKLGKIFLDMMLVQRSGDMLTASGPGCVNEVQYAALLMMVARHCRMIPGVFTHVVANEQIYDRHFEAAEELIKRFERRDIVSRLSIENPKLVLNSEKNDFYTMTVDDFTVVNYDPELPQIKLELGI